MITSPHRGLRRQRKSIVFGIARSVSGTSDYDGISGRWRWLVHGQRQRCVRDLCARHPDRLIGFIVALHPFCDANYLATRLSVAAPTLDYRGIQAGCPAYQGYDPLEA